jgi:hypothetical protein
MPRPLLTIEASCERFEAEALAELLLGAAVVVVVATGVVATVVVGAVATVVAGPCGNFSVARLAAAWAL